MSDYTTRVLEQVRAKNAHEPEFLQAVQEVISTIEPVLSANKKYEDNCILERITEPERTIIFRVPWMDDNGKITEDVVKVRYVADYPIVTPQEIDLIDVAPNQISSIAASLIPFLEHDDANRALMGSNMMRQAVPLMMPEAPIVGTGIERYVARDSRTIVEAEGDGEVVFVDSTKIVIRYDRTDKERLVSFDGDEKTYNLIKYARTNQSTSINQKPIVKKGQKVTKGQILTEGYATQGGDLALGRNLMVAFMPWKGYNYEDAIVISERIVREDLFTSIHIEEFTLEVRDTKRGLEELTNDIPNVSAEATKDLDENGLIRVGAEVTEGDILIGNEMLRIFNKSSFRQKIAYVFQDSLLITGTIKDNITLKDSSFTERLLELIQKSGQKNSAIYKKANISKQHFSKLINDAKATITKPVAVALALALELDHPEPFEEGVKQAIAHLSRFF